MMERQCYTILSKNFPDFMKYVVKSENKISSVQDKFSKSILPH